MNNYHLPITMLKCCHYLVDLMRWQTGLENCKPGERDILHMIAGYHLVELRVELSMKT